MMSQSGKRSVTRPTVNERACQTNLDLIQVTKQLGKRNQPPSQVFELQS
jgi:hypothetical protein